MLKFVGDVVKALAWALSVIFLFTSVFTFQVNAMAACLLLASALLSNPLLINLTKLKKWISFLIVPVLLFATYKTAEPVKTVNNPEIEAVDETGEGLLTEDIGYKFDDLLEEETYFLVDRAESDEFHKAVIENETESSIEDIYGENVSKENTITWAESVKEMALEESRREQGIQVSKPSAEDKTKDTTDEKETADSKLEVHFVDVDQGDCILITCDGRSMLIDAGDNSKGTTVQLYLKKHDVESLDYVIGTHPDADHIGGMDVILYKYDCGTVIMPVKSSDTKTYREVIDTLDEKNYSITYPVVGTEYQLGGAKFVIAGPSKEYEDDNNSSVIIKLTHGDNTFLFTGDAEELAEKDCIFSGIDIKSAVLKIGHHGSHTSSSLSFLRAVNPKYAVISCGQDNEYGHPHAETLNNLRQFDCQVFRTDEQGSIVAISDGKTIQWNCSPSETWKAGERTGSQNSSSVDESHSSETSNPDEKDEGVDEPTDNEETTDDVEPSGAYYILNTNTKVFHYPHCKSVNQMSEKNKKYSYDSRDEIESQGYKSCGNCHP